ncbi:putative serine-rich, partial [Hyphodiscus hymeniophilus]
MRYNASILEAPIYYFSPIPFVAFSPSRSSSIISSTPTIYSSVTYTPPSMHSQMLFLTGAAALASLVSGDIFFTMSGQISTVAGTPFNITWASTTGAEDSVTLLLRKGDADALSTVATIASSIQNTGWYLWTPSSSLPSGTDYAFQIVDDADEAVNNYSGHFPLVSSGTSSSSSSLPSSSASASITSTTSMPPLTSSSSSTSTHAGNSTFTTTVLASSSTGFSNSTMSTSASASSGMTAAASSSVSTSTETQIVPATTAIATGVATLTGSSPTESSGPSNSGGVVT